MSMKNYQKRANTYDMQSVYNWTTILGDNPFLWWLPFYQPKNEGNGMFFPKLGEAKADDAFGVL